jgi:hypothetical protein
VADAIARISARAAAAEKGQTGHRQSAMPHKANSSGRLVNLSACLLCGQLTHLDELLMVAGRWVCLRCLEWLVTDETGGF